MAKGVQYLSGHLGEAIEDNKCLAFLDTVRTERLEQVLALGPIWRQRDYVAARKQRAETAIR